MKVKEIIEKLKELPEDCEVWFDVKYVSSEDNEIETYRGSINNVSMVNYYGNIVLLKED